MIAVALACLPVFLTGREIARWEGGVFLLYYVAYVAYLILAAQQHDALGSVLQRDAELRDPDHGGHAGGDVAASGARRRHVALRPAQGCG